MEITNGLSTWFTGNRFLRPESLCNFTATKKYDPMKRLFYLFLILCSSSGCMVDTYYLCVVDSPVEVYSSPAFDRKLTTIQTSQKLVAGKRKSNYRQVSVGQLDGYIRNISFSSETEYSWIKLKALRKLTDTTQWSDSHTLSSSGTGGTVQVKGYLRKDGTYVKPHTRSAPRKR